MDFLFLAELFVNGLSTGLMYSLVALGITLIYKASGVPNLAQGAMVMLSGYLVWAVVSLLSWPLWLAIALAVVGMFLFGLATERWLLRRMVGQPVIMIVMLTLGLDIFLRGFVPGLLGAAPKRLDLGIGLAPIIVNQIYDLIREIRDSGITVLLVEQNARKALGICDYAYVLENGKINLSGSGEELLKSDAVRKAYLGNMITGGKA